MSLSTLWESKTHAERNTDWSIRCSDIVYYRKSSSDVWHWCPSEIYARREMCFDYTVDRHQCSYTVNSMHFSNVLISSININKKDYCYKLNIYIDLTNWHTNIFVIRIDLLKHKIYKQYYFLNIYISISLFQHFHILFSLLTIIY